MAPIAFTYNTSVHRSIKATPFFLTHGVDAWYPSFPNPVTTDQTLLQRIKNGRVVQHAAALQADSCAAQLGCHRAGGAAIQ